jgi:hypothetical protein
VGSNFRQGDHLYQEPGMANETTTIDDLVSEIDAFEPTDDSMDNEERLQIWVDRWTEAENKESAIPSMLRLFERYPETAMLGEPGPMVHAIEQVPGYEQWLAASLENSPSYYGVWMVNRILESDLPADARVEWMKVLHKVASSESAPPSVRGTAQEFLGFQEG